MLKVPFFHILSPLRGEGEEKNLLHKCSLEKEMASWQGPSHFETPTAVCFSLAS